MKVVFEIGDYRVEYNGGRTWLLIDNHGDCYGAFDTERKAKNALKRTARDAGLDWADFKAA